eukprot:CAMPEP_0170444468 /NCGR_PEP_ID=MMETSP0117_2-20130122/48547_1 /TAXON_ID=400756 /ORGANISM="Durinskia baltica, Strain CSIRO CS-38" /LENGTH=79 /DNA_ID=CAMNT_0010705285 /DNA_START=463 /DNA_END=699 /DNA_ORIENTATION=-
MARESSPRCITAREISPPTTAGQRKHTSTLRVGVFHPEGYPRTPQPSQALMWSGKTSSTGGPQDSLLSALLNPRSRLAK